MAGFGLSAGGSVFYGDFAECSVDGPSGLFAQGFDSAAVDSHGHRRVQREEFLPLSDAFCEAVCARADFIFVEVERGRRIAERQRGAVDDGDFRPVRVVKIAVVRQGGIADAKAASADDIGVDINGLSGVLGRRRAP